MKADGGFGFIDIFLGGDTKDGQKLSNSAIRSLAPMILGLPTTATSHHLAGCSEL